MTAKASSALAALRLFFRLLIFKLGQSWNSISNFQISQHESEDHEKEFVWLEAYKAALMEFNEQRLSATIAAAMKAIDGRKQALERDRKNSQEWNLLEHAALTLWSIKASRSAPICQNEQRLRIATK